LYGKSAGAYPGTQRALAIFSAPQYEDK